MIGFSPVKQHVSGLWRYTFLLLILLVLVLVKSVEIVESLMGIPTNILAPMRTTAFLEAHANQNSQTTMGNIIPMPVSVQATGGTFALQSGTKIYVEAGSDELTNIGQFLADKLKPATGYDLQVETTAGTPAKNNIYLTITGAASELGDEGYELTITQDMVTLVAPKPAGLFRGIQTIRQLFPPTIESSTVQAETWSLPTGTIKDYPRFAWRGAMLDVARHFFDVEDVKRFIDLIAYYKLNRFHLHLADDQGWRIEIKAWPKLTTHGGLTEVGGGEGGYYTQEQYAEIVAYAEQHYITVVPEIDMPGHTNAALASYPELNCDGKAPELYTGIEVGFSSLCVSKEITYTFIDDVIRELAALTPGAYIHIGGDEAAATSEEDYIKFIERIEDIVQSHGKQVVGWEEISRTELYPTTIVQHWGNSQMHTKIPDNVKVIMSPASKAYMDMKYDDASPLGLNWAGFIKVEDGYNWEPTTYLPGVPAENVVGVEAPLWSETLETIEDIEYMIFPRLPGYAEIGWSPAEGRNWNEYKSRLASHGNRFEAMGANFYRSPSVPWQE